MTGTRRALAVLTAAGLVASVVAANWLTARYGLVPAGFGLLVPAGTYAAGIVGIESSDTASRLQSFYLLA